MLESRPISHASRLASYLKASHGATSELRGHDVRRSRSAGVHQRNRGATHTPTDPASLDELYQHVWTRPGVINIKTTLSTVKGVALTPVILLNAPLTNVVIKSAVANLRGAGSPFANQARLPDVTANIVTIQFAPTNSLGIWDDAFPATFFGVASALTSRGCTGCHAPGGTMPSLDYTFKPWRPGLAGCLVQAHYG